jgi:hypothetical protein
MFIYIYKPLEFAITDHPAIVKVTMLVIIQLDVSTFFFLFDDRAICQMIIRKDALLDVSIRSSSQATVPRAK